MLRKLAISAAALGALTVLAFGSSEESAEDKAARQAKEQAEEQAREAEEAEREAKIVAAEADSTETATLNVRADIGNRKPNRKHWDFAKGRPDPEITIENRRTGRTLITDVAKDSFSTTASFEGVRLNPGDSLVITLEDSDVGMSDEVGTCTVAFEPGGGKACEFDAGYLEIEFR